MVVSEECGYAKPHRRFFEYTMGKIKSNKPIKPLVIGDRLETDIKGANDFGLDSCWYNPDQKPEDKEINISLFKTEAERNLHRKIIDVSSKVKELNLSKKFRGVLTLVATLNPEIDDFFDKVLVMDENPEKRKNNFILLSELYRLLNNVAFLSELN